MKVSEALESIGEGAGDKSVLMLMQSVNSKNRHTRKDMPALGRRCDYLSPADSARKSTRCIACIVLSFPWRCTPHFI